MLLFVCEKAGMRVCAGNGRKFEAGKIINSYFIYFDLIFCSLFRDQMSFLRVERMGSSWEDGSKPLFFELCMDVTLFGGGVNSDRGFTNYDLMCVLFPVALTRLDWQPNSEWCDILHF